MTVVSHGQKAGKGEAGGWPLVSWLSLPMPPAPDSDPRHATLIAQSEDQALVHRRVPDLHWAVETVVPLLCIRHVCQETALVLAVAHTLHADRLHDLVLGPGPTELCAMLGDGPHDLLAVRWSLANMNPGSLRSSDAIADRRVPGNGSILAKVYQ